MNPARRLVPALLLAAAVAACGSTVQTRGAIGLGGGSGGETTPDGTYPSTASVVVGNDGASGDPGTAGTAGTASLSGSTSGDSSTRSTSAGATAGEDTSSSTTGGATKGLLAGPGVTATTINIGFAYSVNGGAANAAIGGAGVTQGDEKAEAEVLRDDINAHGGIAGHKVVLVEHAIDALTTQTTAQLEAAVCADFTQDHKVFGAIVGTENLLTCLDKEKGVAVLDNLAVSDRTKFSRHPYYVEPSLFDLDRLSGYEVRSLQQQKYFSPWNATTGGPGAQGGKVGFITFDDPAFRGAAVRSMLPALKAAGHPAASADVVYVHVPANQADLSTTSAAISNAVLKFQSDGVDHVVLFDSGGTMSLLFLNRAESQHYRPRYAVNSDNGMGLLLDAGDVQAVQLVGALGMGWFPFLDVPNAANPDNGPYSNNARRSCLALMAKHGLTFPDANAKAVPLLFCNSFYFFKQAIENGLRATGSPAITRDVFLAGVNATGERFQSGATFSTSFRASKHDGAGSYRNVAFDETCQCMTYTSGPQDAS